MATDADRLPARQLRVEHLRKEFQSARGPLVVIDDVSLELSPGDTISIVGPSGAGKSTLLNIIGSLDRPTAGTVRLGDVEVTALDGAELAAFRSRQVGFVFQDHHLLPQCSAIENVMLPTLAAGTQDTGPERSRELLERVGLEDRLDALPATLSGGERQRVAIARAMVNAPALLLCDEPTGNLDQDTGGRIAELFLELACERGAMLMVVTHDMELAGRLGRVLALQDGALHEQEN